MTTLVRSSVDRFRGRADRVVAAHPIVTGNRYTRWFAEGHATDAEVRHLTVQFSVFSHLFVEAQLRKCINATTLESYRAGKEILLNICTMCHDLGRIRLGHRSPEEWEETLISMLNEGAPLSEEQFPVIHAYLSKNFGIE